MERKLSQKKGAAKKPPPSAKQRIDDRKRNAHLLDLLKKYNPPNSLHKAPEKDLYPSDKVKSLPYLKVNLDFSKNFKTLEETFILQFIIYSSLSNEHRKRSKYFANAFYWTIFSINGFNQIYQCISKDKLKSAVKKIKDEELIFTEIIYRHDNLSQSTWYRPNFNKLKEIGLSKQEWKEFFHLS